MTDDARDPGPEDLPGASVEARRALALRVLKAEANALASGLIPEHSNIMIRHRFIHAEGCAGAEHWPSCACEPRIELSWHYVTPMRPTVQ